MKKKIKLFIVIPELRHGGTEKFIKFEGNQNDLNHYYKEHEYFVFSSFFEGGQM
tara:strand:- start:96 stop:257 length:162 start_codon:yes stop_codon:yes gene_type:complete